MFDTFGSHLLTAELLGPLAVNHGDSVKEAATRIPQVLADLVVPRSGGGSVRLTDHDVRSALTTPGHVAVATPFAWSARTARRSLGLAAVRSLLAGASRTPTDGTRTAIAQAIGTVREGRQPTSTMDRWLAGLPAAGVTAVQAEAVTWATRLWCALDWGGFEEPPIIGRDRWWDSPHSSLLAVRSRAEVRSVAVDPAGNPTSVHLVVLGGPRRSTIRSELSVVAMVEALLAPRSLPPGRIVGWWPDSGRLVKVEIDPDVLGAGVSAVARALAGAEPKAAPLEGARKAAA
jgi:hypothetical protein